MEWRLAAILVADVVGYTRLMGADETGTLRHLTELRQQVLEPLIAEHHGRVVKLIGDGLLVEFATVVDAKRDRELPEPGEASPAAFPMTARTRPFTCSRKRDNGGTTAVTTGNCLTG